LKHEQSSFSWIIRNAHDGLTRTVFAVPDDKMTWKPLDNGRTVLDLLGKCNALAPASPHINYNITVL